MDNVKNILLERKRYSEAQLDYFIEMKRSVEKRPDLESKAKIDIYDNFISRLKIDIKECDVDLSKL